MWILLLFIFNVLQFISPYKILLVCHAPIPSHHFLISSLAKGLTEAGHDTTIISVFTEKNPPKNGTYRQIVLTKMQEQDSGVARGQLFGMGKMSALRKNIIVSQIGNVFTKRIFDDPNFQKLIQSNETFDCVILPQFLNDAMKAIANHYKAPLIVFSTIGANNWINPLVGNPAPPSYIPNIYVNYGSKMTFWKRFVNVLITFSLEMYQHIIFLPAQNELMKKTFPNAPDLNVLNYNVSLVLLNSHESINQPMPYVPNMIDIGGFHVKPPKPLPNDLQEFLDNAKDGVIYFSLGSTIQPSEMSNHTKMAIVESFRKLKQKVLWKWDKDELQDRPKNVRISKWFPQQDILAHPNVKVFITHGGLLSLIETIYHGVPVLAFPIFADQQFNANRVEEGGFGIYLPFVEITTSKISDALDKLLNDPRYRENAKIRSSLMHDRPMKPLDAAIYWTEFVIRHKGAPHLRLSSLDLSWYQYFLLDVIGLVTVITLTIIVFLYFIYNTICLAFSRSYKVKVN